MHAVLLVATNLLIHGRTCSLYWGKVTHRGRHHWIFLRRRRWIPLDCFGDFGRRREKRLAAPELTGIRARRFCGRRPISSSTAFQSSKTTLIVSPQKLMTLSRLDTSVVEVRSVRPDRINQPTFAGVLPPPGARQPVRPDGTMPRHRTGQ